MIVKPVRAVIADDERLARERIRRLLRAEPHVEVVRECADGESAVESIVSDRPDLVFLDVQMPGLDAFEVLDAVRRRDETIPLPVVIVVTAFDQHALQAFDVHAVDYLVKPFAAERFRTAVARSRAALSRGGESHEAGLLTLIERLTRDKRELERRLTGEAADGAGVSSGESRRWLERLQIRVDGRILFVRTADVDWIESSSNYVRVHVGNESHLLRESLTSIAARLDPARFARIHRTTVVNIDRVREIQPWFSGDYVVLLRTGAKLKMSRNYRHLIDDRAGEEP